MSETKQTTMDASTQPPPKNEPKDDTGASTATPAEEPNKIGTEQQQTVETTEKEQPSKASPSTGSHPRDEKSELGKDEPASKRSKVDTVGNEKDEDKEYVQEDEDKDNGEKVDMAKDLGFKAGDRLEVEWEIVDPDDEAKTASRWWGCTLLEHDGRVEGPVAVRVLEYDAYPEGGFPEKSKEDVLFITHEILYSPDSEAEFRYRPEGEDDTVAYMSEEEMREVLNGILMGAMKKQSGKWSALTPAQQASIAALIADKKEQLLDAIKARSGSIINADHMQEILSEIMA